MTREKALLALTDVTLRLNHRRATAKRMLNWAKNQRRKKLA